MTLGPLPLPVHNSICRFIDLDRVTNPRKANEDADEHFANVGTKFFSTTLYAVAPI
jgi:hypothetical protein